MSSPNHPTSDVEDAFSFNFPDYLLVSPDYVPASPEKTYSSSSNNSFGLNASQKDINICSIGHDSRSIKQLVAGSITIALEAQAANMANTDNTNRNPEPRESHFERTKLVFSCDNCTKDYKVKFATGTLTEESLSWWNSFPQPIRIEEAYKLSSVEFKKVLIKKYCPRTELQKMEDEFYHLTMKGNDLKTHVRRFQELATSSPTMVSDYEKMIEAFIEGLPQSIKGNVTTSKPQTLEEAINIPQRLTDQRKRALCKSVLKDHQQQCPGESLHAKG
nr:reverse transcriptase domain-containing protein [Tanacetum cinerariifolium]